MGRDKALLELDGELLVERGLRTLGEVCAEVAIAGGSEELNKFGRVIPDGVIGCGPLGGIVAALEQSRSDWNLFLPVDTPFVPASCLRELILATDSSDGVGVVARVGGKLQPLCAAYSRKALPVLRKELADGRWKVTDAIAAAGGYGAVEFEDERWFRNLNTPEEFAEAERHLDALDT